jgi:hypothetical protein
MAKLVMAGFTPKKIGEKLRSEFAERYLVQNQSIIASIMEEKGMLGKVYIDASHFPHLASNSAERKGVLALCKQAKFVIGGCGGLSGCNCHKTGYCALYGGKRVVQNVPYGPKLAAMYNCRIGSALPQTQKSWKKAIQESILSPITKIMDPVQTIQQQPIQVKPVVSSKDIENYLSRREAGVPVTPGPQYMKFARRMMIGYNDMQMLLASTDPELRALAGEFGLLGHSYFDIDAIGGCKNALKVISSKNIQPSYFIRRTAQCPACKCLNGGGCHQLKQMGEIIPSKPPVTREVYVAALRQAHVQGRITAVQLDAAAKMSDKADWVRLTAQVNLYKPISQTTDAYAGAKVSAFYGTRPESDSLKSTLVMDKVRRVVSHLMNTGLRGKQLQEAVANVYSDLDLAKLPKIQTRLASDDGVQGQYFIDPTAYNDYGKGCNDGAKLFRKRGAPNILASDGCIGCTLQTAPGWCSKFAKPLITQVPAEVREQVAAKRSLPLVNNISKVDPSDKYELKSELKVDLKGSKSRSLDIDISSRSL